MWSWAGLIRAKAERGQSVITGMRSGAEADWLTCHQSRKAAARQPSAVVGELGVGSPAPWFVLFSWCHHITFCLVSRSRVLASPSNPPVPTSHSTWVLGIDTWLHPGFCTWVLAFELRHVCLCSGCSFSPSHLPSYSAHISESGSHCIYHW